jgi:hypothetical protein
MASRIRDPEGAGFTDAELALLRALPLMKAGTAGRAIEELRGHFDVGEDRGEIGQIICAFGMYRGIHSTMAMLGAEIVDDEGPLSERSGFGVVTMDDGRFLPRDEFELP